MDSKKYEQQKEQVDLEQEQRQEQRQHQNEDEEDDVGARKENKYQDQGQTYQDEQDLYSLIASNSNQSAFDAICDLQRLATLFVETSQSSSKACQNEPTNIFNNTNNTSLVDQTNTNNNSSSFDEELEALAADAGGKTNILVTDTHYEFNLSGNEHMSKQTISKLLNALDERVQQFTDSAYTSHEHRQIILSLISCIKLSATKLAEVSPEDETTHQQRNNNNKQTNLRSLSSPLKFSATQQAADCSFQSHPMTLKGASKQPLHSTLSCFATLSSHKANDDEAEQQLNQSSRSPSRTTKLFYARALRDLCAELVGELQSSVVEHSDEFDFSAGHCDLLRELRRLATLGDFGRVQEMNKRLVEQTEQLTDICRMLNEVSPTIKMKIKAQSLANWFELNCGQLGNISQCLCASPLSKVAKTCLKSYTSVWTSFYDDFCHLARQIAYQSHVTCDESRAERVATFRKLFDVDLDSDTDLEACHVNTRLIGSKNTIDHQNDFDDNLFGAPASSSPEPEPELAAATMLLGVARSPLGVTHSSCLPTVSALSASNFFHIRQPPHSAPATNFAHQSTLIGHIYQHPQHPQQLNLNHHQQIETPTAPKVTLTNDGGPKSLPVSSRRLSLQQAAPVLHEQELHYHNDQLNQQQKHKHRRKPRPPPLDVENKHLFNRHNIKASNYEQDLYAKRAILKPHSRQAARVPVVKIAEPEQHELSAEVAEYNQQNHQANQMPGAETELELKNAARAKSKATFKAQVEKESESDIGTETEMGSEAENEPKSVTQLANRNNKQQIDKWSHLYTEDDADADAIIRGAREAKQMADSMYQFTEGEGELNTTQDLFTQAELLADNANELYKEVRCFSYKVPSGPYKKELLFNLDVIPTLVQQLQFSVKNTTVGKPATFAKVDSIIRDTKNLVGAVDKVVTSTMSCREHYNMTRGSMRKRTRMLSPSYRSSDRDSDDYSTCCQFGGGGAFGSNFRSSNQTNFGTNSRGPMGPRSGASAGSEPNI